MSQSKRRSYTDEFKAEAVKLVTAPVKLDTHLGRDVLAITCKSTSSARRCRVRISSSETAISSSQIWSHSRIRFSLGRSHLSRSRW